MGLRQRVEQMHSWKGWAAWGVIVAAIGMVIALGAWLYPASPGAAPTSSSFPATTTTTSAPLSESTSTDGLQTSTTAPGNTSQPTTPDGPIYENQLLSVSPLSCSAYQPAIDFDEPATYENYADSAAYKTADLWYETCVGSLQQRAGAFIGVGPPSLPEPKECWTAAKTRPIGKLDIRSVKTGNTFCVVTSNQQIAWFTVKRKGAPFHETLDDGAIPTIEFNVTLWPSL